MHYGGYEILNAHCTGLPVPLPLFFSGSFVCHFRSQSFAQSDFIWAPPACLKRENFSLFMGTMADGGGKDTRRNSEALKLHATLQYSRKYLLHFLLPAPFAIDEYFARIYGDLCTCSRCSGVSGSKSGPWPSAFERKMYFCFCFKKIEYIM